ncbi:MAG TPA: hypothetical protein VFT27_04580 [Actinomycetota bacterium]|nr:hypothetical protein [Actinomycetota bacterium]
MGAADLEARIDELYALPLDRFIPERDAVAKELRSAGDREAADLVKSQRKPVVAAWALNRLAREEPAAVEELAAVGERLRAAQQRALSGGDTEPLRKATEERRAVVARLAAAARAILEREGTDPGPHADDLTNTLDAAVVAEDAAEALAAGRLTKALRPPSGFGDATGLVALPGGRPAHRAKADQGTAPASAGSPAAKTSRAEADRARERRALERELAQVRSRQRRDHEAVERARRLLDDLDRRRADAKDRLRAAEAEQRGAAVEIKRLETRLAKLAPTD